MNLPAGLTSRPLGLDDAEAVTALITAEELHDVGATDVAVEDVVAEWQRPSYDLASSSIGVLDGPRLVAYADLVHPDFGYTGVLPAERGRGIGTALAGWLEALARSRGATLLSNQVPRDGAQHRLLAARGYRERWTAWDLELPEGAEVTARPLPAGFAVRDARPDEHELVYEVIETAFSDWRDKRALDDFASVVWGRPTHEAWNLRVCTDPDGVVVGATHVHLTGEAGYVARIGVRREQRGRGLASAMLADAFGLAREHGAVRCYLATDSRTGALGLYEKVGMQVSSAWVNLALDLAADPSGR